MKFPLLTTLLLSSAIARAEPVHLILDCDMGNDVDDVMELAMIHALETRGVCQLLAVTLTKDHPKAAAFTSQINTFYGRGDIPIGVVHQGAAREEGKYLGIADDDATYPHALKSGADAPEAVSLLRKTLAAGPTARWSSSRPASSPTSPGSWIRPRTKRPRSPGVTSSPKKSASSA